MKMNYYMKAVIS